jgi:hypothetical protein
MLLGIRRATSRQQSVMPSSVLSSDSMHIGVLAAAAHAAATSSRFQVFYNPRFFSWISLNDLAFPNILGTEGFINLVLFLIIQDKPIRIHHPTFKVQESRALHPGLCGDAIPDGVRNR